MNKYKTGLILSIGMLTISALSAQKDVSSFPNIIVFIADDAGMDFGCYGNKVIKTPNIDKLTREGIRFEKAYLTSPQSSPSRTSMMTGMFAHTIGTEDLHIPIDSSTLMMPHYFKKAGYLTGFMQKTHWGKNGDNQFDRMLNDGALISGNELSNEIYNNYTQFVEEAKDKPFFLWVGFWDPHRSYNRTICPQENDPAKLIVPPFLVDGEDTRRDLADYYDEITRMDGDIGRMVSYLEQKGILENTVVVFLSDNGMPFPRAKGTLYDSGIQTPLIFMWKNRIQKNVVHDNGLISTIDLAPTLLELAGAKMSDEVYGKSFMLILFDHTKRGRDYIFAERNWHDTDEYIRCVRTEKFKLIYNAYYEIPHGTAMDLSSSLSWYELKDKQRKGELRKEQMQIFEAPRAMVEIYDLEKDPYELNNVADLQAYYKEGRKMTQLLEEWQKETKDHPWWWRRRPDQSDRVTGFPLYLKRGEFLGI
ncbi:MAG: sulfatase [Tannerellaceae bacterium]|jgi:arylsulfatase A-like enzyme|nr:sulfatase [Tannerellaceae bacterium]